MSLLAISIVFVAVIYALVKMIKNEMVDSELRIRRDLIDIGMMIDGTKEDNHEYHKKFFIEGDEKRPDI